jgi:hypothetical protein
LKPYLDSLSSIKSKRLAFKPKATFRDMSTFRDSNRKKLKQEINRKTKHISPQITSMLLNKQSNDSGVKFDLFVPHKTMADFKPKNITLNNFKVDRGR